MKIISLWVSALLFSFGILALTSYLENGYQEELLTAEVLREAISHAKAEDALEKRKLHRELYLLSVDAKRTMESKAK